LNYNGRDLLSDCLPSIMTAAEQAKTHTAVTVLDNQSTDDSVAWIQKNFPKADIFKASANRVLCSYNEILPQIKEPVAVLLNNDIRVAPDFIDPLLEQFAKDPECFLVAPRVLSFDGTKTEAGRSKSGIKWGLFWCDARFKGYESELNVPSQTDSSGFGAFSRDKFVELGGYDDRFHPGIMEDVDLCHRAKKAGYHLYYEPRSVVYHMGQASFKKNFGVRGISVMAYRNNFLFMWKNFKDFRFRAAHILYLPFRLLFALLKGNTAMLEGFIQALKKKNAV
jgi:N-acetylglucosaminyl-diphospho-decaprenol L-rhamnosyltransferase